MSTYLDGIFSYLSDFKVGIYIITIVFNIICFFFDYSSIYFVCCTELCDPSKKVTIFIFPLFHFNHNYPHRGKIRLFNWKLNHGQPFRESHMLEPAIIRSEVDKGREFHPRQTAVVLNPCAISLPLVIRHARSDPDIHGSHTLWFVVAALGLRLYFLHRAIIHSIFFPIRNWWCQKFIWLVEIFTRCFWNHDSN